MKDLQGVEWGELKCWTTSSCHGQFKKPWSILHPKVSHFNGVRSLHIPRMRVFPEGSSACLDKKTTLPEEESVFVSIYTLCLCVVGGRQSRSLWDPQPPGLLWVWKPKRLAAGSDAVPLATAEHPHAAFSGKVHLRDRHCETHKDRTVLFGIKHININIAMLSVSTYGFSFHITVCFILLVHPTHSNIQY